ncbi:hypothetical protein [Streptomyces incanus]|uniref:Uncharacterized protein n=1 Tax=Streptomyces incanus TaxID=887453 RepID=A0ABW0XRS2_9ACTN
MKINDRVTARTRALVTGDAEKGPTGRRGALVSVAQLLPAGKWME